MGRFHLGPDFRPAFLTFFIPFAYFVGLDLLSTYVGVCMLGGFEVTPIAVLISKLGFILLSIYQFGTYAGFAAMLAFFYVNAARPPGTIRKQIIRTFTIVVFALALMDYINVLLMNASSLLQVAGINVQLTEMPGNQTLAVAQQTFIEQGQNFCRWLP